MTLSHSLSGLLSVLVCALRCALPASPARPAPLAGGGVKLLPAASAGARRRDPRERPDRPERRGAHAGALAASLRRFAHEARASAGYELAVGAVGIVFVAYAAFDVYSLTRANAAGVRVAATMADYVSLETAPSGDEMAALGRFLKEREFAAPASLVYVVSAVHQPPGKEDVKELWTEDGIRIGDKETTAALVAECGKQGKASWRAQLLGDDAKLDLQADDKVIVVEVCFSLPREGMLTSKFVGDVLYRVHALPHRAQSGPEKPAYSSKDKKKSASVSGEAGRAAFSRALSGPAMEQLARGRNATAPSGGIA